MDKQILYIVKRTICTGAIINIKFVTSKGNVYDCVDCDDVIF